MFRSSSRRRFDIRDEDPFEPVEPFDNWSGFDQVEAAPDPAQVERFEAHEYPEPEPGCEEQVDLADFPAERRGPRLRLPGVRPPRVGVSARRAVVGGALGFALVVAVLGEQGDEGEEPRPRIKAPPEQVPNRVESSRPRAEPRVKSAGRHSRRPALRPSPGARPTVGPTQTVARAPIYGPTEQEATPVSAPPLRAEASQPQDPVRPPATPPPGSAGEFDFENCAACRRP
jgi:hypothetical protein